MRAGDKPSDCLAARTGCQPLYEIRHSALRRVSYRYQEKQGLPAFQFR
jgi:hypothetical protein